ncbi:hypothetical protein [Sulfuriflexus sp.]|uniref:hypothetical protein n=1 Tax=Sulfuriflexus sp. TaxID=2015443 RepID=UPI0028CEFDB3|nr:hypothetical protein [Sulfuriflexus sp.]MDT8405527.1 hypothetical protein [Sulfuriflexus sp.]
MKAGAILNIVLLLLVPMLAAAQTPVYVDVSQCRAITVDVARVACYDALADRAMTQSGAEPVIKQDAISRQNAAPQGSDGVQLQGARLQEENKRMREELARLRKEEEAANDADRLEQFGKSDQAVVTTEDDEEILHDRIKSLKRAPDGWIITLASGQVWQQKYNRAYNLKEGQEVKIYTATWGNSYRLAASELKGFIDVRRLR